MILRTKNKMTNSNKKTFALSLRITIYIIVMLIGIVLRTYIMHSASVVWAFNLLGLIFLFIPYYRYSNVTVAIFSTVYIVFSFLTIVLNSNYLTGSIKALGTNVNIISLPIILSIACSYRVKTELKGKTISKVLYFISFCGLFSVAFAWIINFGEILSVFNGASVYSVNVSGFFYGKNIYGAFVALTIAADLYILSIEKNLKRIAVIGIKFLAVVLSFSRAALLQAGVMLFVFLWTQKRKKSQDYIVLGIVFIVAISVVVAILQSSQLYNFMYDSVFRVSVGDAGRQMLRNEAIEKVSDNLVGLIFGVGFFGIDILNIDIDNTYLYILFSGGVIKSLYYFVSMILSIVHIIYLKQADKNLYRICLSVYVSYLFFAWFESVAVLELGLLNFVFSLFIFVIPFSHRVSCKNQYEPLGD